MKLAGQLFVLMSVIALSGCSYLSKNSVIQSRDKAYLSAKSIPPLKIPPGIASSSFQNSFPVSERQYSVSAEDVSIIPPGL